MTTNTQAAAPQMTFVENAAFQLSVAMEKESAVVRGWNAGSDPDVLAAVGAYNDRERARCKAAALASLKL